MRFGLQLDHILSPWRSETMSYDILADELRPRRSSPWTAENKRLFEHHLQHEATKVHQFISTHTRYIESTIAEGALDEHQRAMTLYHIYELFRFVCLNMTGFEKTFKRHIKWTGEVLRYPAHFLDQPAYLKPLQACLSTLLQGSRDGGVTLTDFVPAMAAPDQGAGIAEKYWVCPEHLEKVKETLTLHLPVVKPGSTLSRDPPGDRVIDTYYDNADFDLYLEQLQRRPCAETLCVRRHVGGAMSDAAIVEVERSTLDAPWNDDRIQLQADDMKAVIEQGRNPNLLSVTPERQDEATAGPLVSAALAIHACVHDRRLDPKVCVCYRRTSFQSTVHSPWIIVVEEDVGFSLPDGQGKEGWERRFPFAVLTVQLDTLPGQQMHPSPPAWLTRLTMSRLVHKVPHFSLYVQAASDMYDTLPLLPWWRGALYQPVHSAAASIEQAHTQGKASPINTRDHRQPTVGGNTDEATGDQDRRECQSTHSGSPDATIVDLQEPRPLLDQDTTSAKHLTFASTGWQLGCQTRSASTLANPEDGGQMPQWNRKLHKARPRPPKKRIEPKVFFANERTFISWLQFCALMLTVALNMINFGDRIARICGASFLGLATILAVYALGRYQHRARILRTQDKSTRVDDLYGPAILCLLIIAALAVNFVLRFHQPPPADQHAPGTVSMTGHGDDLM